MSYPPGPNQSAQYNSNQNPQATSPSNQAPYAAPPPAKRQRLSPDVGSPGAPYVNGVNRAPAVASGYGNPFAPPGQAPYSPVAQSPGQQQYSSNSFNTPNAYAGNRSPWQAQSNQQFAAQRPQNAGSPPSSQMMPPPPRPIRDEKEEKVGVDDINDALFSSGINLKDEENYMHNMYSNRHSATDSFQTQQGSSFGSTTMSQGNSFNLLTQGTSFGSQQNGVGTIGLALSQDDIDAELKHKRTAAAKAKAEYDQHALNRPFLHGNVLRHKFKKTADHLNVKLDQSGVMYDHRAQTQVMMNGDRSNGIAATSIPVTVDRQAPFADIIGLLTLASGERIRDLLDQSYTLSRARRYADQGRVPPEFKDVAVSNGESETVDIVPEAITDTPWDQPAEPKTDKPESTIAFQSVLNNKLRSLVKTEQDGEKARLQRREARRKAAEANANGTEDSTLDASAMDTTSAAPGTPGADLSAASKITKKELARQQKERANATEAQAATSTNQTAAMMVMGGRKKYSWMSGGAASMPTNRFAKPALATSGSSTGTSTPVRKNKTNAADKAADDASAENEMTWGAWREDSAGGKGIQLRDWLLVLERDGKEKKAFAQAAIKMGSLLAKDDKK